MLNTTLTRLQCPKCMGGLALTQPLHSGDSVTEIRQGNLTCQQCSADFLILAGVALLVEDTYDYLMTHVKGISKVVPDKDIPKEFQNDFFEAKAEIESEHIEEDLEAERVNALYLMTHYLRTNSKPEWWKPLTSAGSPLIDSLIRTYWDQGPFAQIQEWISKRAQTQRFKAVLELGCGVGGLHSILRPYCDFYLGADSSFASIALARHIALGIPYPKTLRIPEDLLQGSVSRDVNIPIATSWDGRTDFVVTDFQNPGIKSGWDLTLALNMIDMLSEPEALPRLQFELLEKSGIAIQSCPYIWHEGVARELREKLPRELHGDSARAVEWLYQEAGFKIEESVDHRPWLFFKHLRQLEIYSVHLIAARKPALHSP